MVHRVQCQTLRLRHYDAVCAGPLSLSIEGSAADRRVVSLAGYSRRTQASGAARK